MKIRLMEYFFKKLSILWTLVWPFVILHQLQQAVMQTISWHPLMCISGYIEDTEGKKKKDDRSKNVR